MGKIDDMRRQREERHAQDERAKARRDAAATVKLPSPATTPATASTATSIPPLVADPEETVPVAQASSRRPTEADEGVCAVCGKVRPLQGGMISSHQKGLGKFCPGSRKPPAA